jgi:hypothetical protein
VSISDHDRVCNLVASLPISGDVWRQCEARMDAGREVYGPLDLSAARDFAREAAEESCDLINYLAMHWLQHPANGRVGKLLMLAGELADALQAELGDEHRVLIEVSKKASTESRTVSMLAERKVVATFYRVRKAGALPDGRDGYFVYATAKHTAIEVAWGAPSACQMWSSRPDARKAASFAGGVVVKVTVRA